MSALSRLGGLAVAALLVLSSAAAVQADTFVGGTTVWTMVGAPTPSVGAFGQLETVSFSNHLTVSVPGVIFMVLRNNSSQMVDLAEATATIAPGAIVAAQLVEFGLAAGTYNATFFAVAYSGVAISLPTSALFTVAVG
jgi:hypothetical protein